MTSCKGCYVQDICIYIEYSEACPCTICIVKMVCRQICPPRASFRARAEMKRGNIKYEQYN